MALPPGLILNPATGEVTGTPTVAGAYTVNLTVRDALGNKREIADAVTINAYTVMSWSGNLLPIMQGRAMNSATVSLAGGQAPITYTLFGGALPTGVTLNASTGSLSGTPSVFGAFAFTIRATDNLAQTKDKTHSITIAENLTLTNNMGATALATVGKAVTFAAPTRAGGTLPITYSMATGALPAGLSLNASTGVISGTPTAVADTSGLAVRATDANGFVGDTTAFAISTKAAPALTGTLARGTATRAYSSSYTPSLGHTPYSFGATSLPAGLSINASTGAITGTPTTAAIYTPVVTLTDADSNVIARSNSVEIAANLELSGTVPAATRAVPYSFQPQKVGGWPNYTYAITAGSLPAGITLNATTGLIAGTPTTQSTNTATLTITDGDGNTATKAVNIDVAGDLVMTGSIQSYGTTTVAYPAGTLGTTGGDGTKTWSIIVGALPPGVSMNTTTGAFSGTPTVPGNYSFTIRVTDPTMSYATGNFTIGVAAFPALSGTLPDGSQNTAYAANYTASGGHLPLVFSISAGTLPAGTSINASTGVISGTPSGTGASTFTVRATDNVGNVVNRAQSITIYALPVISGSYYGYAEQTLFYSSSAVTASGGRPSLSWTLAGGALPPGLSLNAGTGAITGTAGAGTGAYTFTIRVTDTLGRSTTSAQTINLAYKVAINVGARQEATRTIAYSSAFGAVQGWTPYTFSHAGGTLPPGLSLLSTGVLSGTPTVAGNYSFTVRATDNLGVFSDYGTTVYVLAPVTLTGTPAASTVGVVYNFTPGGVYGWGPHSHTIVAGGLPPGLSLNSTNGVVTGTPSSAGTYGFTIRRTDTHVGGGSIADLATSITVAAYPTVSMTNPRGMVGKAYSAQVTGSGGWPAYTFWIPDGELPTGTSLNATTGAISGTPTLAYAPYVRIRLVDQRGNTNDVVRQINIAPALVISGNFAVGQVGVGYSSTIAGGGGYAPYSFSYYGGALPTGLSLSAGGTLSGTPSAAGNFSFVVRVTDADGSVYDEWRTVGITNPVVFSLSASPNPAYGNAFTSGGAMVMASTQTWATPTGHVGSVSYLWTRISSTGSGGSFLFAGSTSNTLYVNHSGNFNYWREETWQLRGTDSSGAVALLNVTFTLEIITNQ